MLGDVEYGALVNKARIRKIEMLEAALIAAQDALHSSRCMLRAWHRFAPHIPTREAMEGATLALTKIKRALND